MFEELEATGKPTGTHNAGLEATVIFIVSKILLQWVPLSRTFYSFHRAKHGPCHEVRVSKQEWPSRSCKGTGPGSATHQLGEPAGSQASVQCLLTTADLIV